MSVLRPLRRRVRRFMADPASPRNATWVIVGVTIVAVFAGSVVVWLLDRRDFSSYGEALWFALQTVTTVGYGDVTPTSVVGRVVGGVVMVVAIGFITVVTAAVTSSFIEAKQRRRHDADTENDMAYAARLEAALAALAAIDTRLDRIEQALASDSRTAVPDPDPPGDA